MMDGCCCVDGELQQGGKEGRATAPAVAPARHSERQQSPLILQEEETRESGAGALCGGCVCVVCCVGAGGRVWAQLPLAVLAAS